jgi:hypothetical protein
MAGRARDATTPPAGGPPVVHAEDSFAARLSFDRTILEIAADPPRPGLAALVGARAGGGLRKAIAAAVPTEHGTPLHLLLDDMAGASLVANWAWSQWDADRLQRARASAGDTNWDKLLANRVGVCIGFAPGASALDPATERGEGARTTDLRNPADPEGWHALPDQTGPAFRRARRMDLRRDDLIRIDAAFQDSATTPDGGRAVVHEYTLTATADPKTLRLVSVEAEPRVLPHRECPSAVGNLSRLLGASVPELREVVLAELRGTAGCTHLNDALRALADAPALLALLPTDA